MVRHLLWLFALQVKTNEHQKGLAGSFGATAHGLSPGVGPSVSVEAHRSSSGGLRSIWNPEEDCLQRHCFMFLLSVWDVPYQREGLGRGGSVEGREVGITRRETPTLQIDRVPKGVRERERGALHWEAAAALRRFWYSLGSPLGLMGRFEFMSPEVGACFIHFYAENIWRGWILTGYLPPIGLGNFS